MSAIKCSTAPDTRRRVEGVIADLKNPDHKRMLQTWLRHWWGEVVYDIDACIETVTDKISYRWYGTDQIGDGVHEDSRDFARTMYQSMFDAKLMPGGPFDQERWAFNDWGLTLEAVFSSVFPGSMLKGKSAQPKPQGLYLVQWPMVVSLPFDRERWLIAGEIMYAGPPMQIEPADTSTVRRLLGRDA
jgi:hypothetical protein